MESFLTRENIRLSMEDAGNMDEASSENFQKFIYELFDKNGILNDLRAYLRGHIVNVLTSAQTGENPMCQKLFTQRLELTFQTFNILIAEYLLTQGFNYSLSVFISEIPLSNMVFAFAKKLLESKSHINNELMRFNNSDICSVLHYLGVQCDSADMTHVLDMYNSTESPSLLVCILKCMQHHYRKPSVTTGDTGFEKISKTLDDNHKLPIGKCRHYENCKICQNRERKVTENLKKQSRKFETMLQQLKSDHHTELESVRREERSKVDEMLETHAHQMHQRTGEIEREYKARESELERGVADKKRFLWGLARTLKDQHASVAKAVAAVREERRRLAGKECSLKDQLKHAEEVFMRRGEELKSQIMNELATLEAHLAVIKKEREALARERNELQNLRLKARQAPVQEKVHYDELRNELASLKKYLESTKIQPKLMLEVATLTEDLCERSSSCLNNMDCYKVSECAGSSRIQERNVDAPNKVVNDLKKQKNINFNVDPHAQVREGLSAEKRDASLSPFSIPRELEKIIEQLQTDNQHFRAVAAQQGAQLETLSSQSARLRAELAAARCALLTPPAPPPAPVTPAAVEEHGPRSCPAPQRPLHAIDGGSLHLSPQRNTATSSRTVAQGGGEGAALFVQGEGPPRVLVPGDVVPFCGTLPTRTDTRRYPLIPRRLTRHLSPSASKQPAVRASRFSPRPISVALFTHAHRHDARNEPTLNDAHQDRQHVEDGSKSQTGKLSPRGKCSKKREKSPSSILREAKMRLRKLEIEAEAVEKSYVTFKERQNSVNSNKNSTVEEEFVTKPKAMKSVIDLKRSRSALQQVGEQSSNFDNVNNFKGSDKNKNIFIDEIAKQDFDIYLKGINISEIKTPKIYETGPINNLLRTPLPEFRKYYQFDHNSRQTIGIAKRKDASSPVIPLHVQNKDDLKEKHNDKEAIMDNSTHKIGSATVSSNSKETSSHIIQLNVQNKQDDLKDKHNDKEDIINHNSINKIGSATIPSNSKETLSLIIPLNIQNKDDLKEKHNDKQNIINHNSKQVIGDATIPSNSKETSSHIISLNIQNKDNLKENHNDKEAIIHSSIHKIVSSNSKNTSSPLISLNIQNRDDLKENHNDKEAIMDSSIHKILASNSTSSPIISLNIQNKHDLKEKHNNKAAIVEDSSKYTQNTKDPESQLGAKSENELLLFREVAKAGETDISVIKVNSDTKISTPNEKEEADVSNNKDIIEGNINLNSGAKEIEDSNEKIEVNDSANETITDMQDFSIDMDDVSKSDSPISLPISEQDNFWGA